MQPVWRILEAAAGPFPQPGLRANELARLPVFGAETRATPLWKYQLASARVGEPCAIFYVPLT